MFRHYTVDAKLRYYSIYLNLTCITVELFCHHICHIFKLRVISSIIEEDCSGWTIEKVGKVVRFLWRGQAVLA